MDAISNNETRQKPPKMITLKSKEYSSYTDRETEKNGIKIFDDDILPGGGGGASGHQNKGYPSNIDPDPVKITKLPGQHSMVGHYLC